MIFYRRNIYSKLIALRGLSIVTGILCYLSFDAGYTSLGYFLSVVLVFLSIIVIKDIVVFPDSFRVKKVYFFGILPISWSFKKNEKVVLHSYTSGFEEEDDADGFSHLETPAGCLFYFYSVFGKKNRVTHRKFTIGKEDGKTGLLGKTEMFLSKQEYQLIKDIIN
jgi:hypothetical protein